MKKEYLKLHEISGPLIVLSHVDDAAYGETVSIKIDNEEKRIGKVIKIEGDKVIVQVFEGTSGISTDNASVKFLGQPLSIPLSKDILGRTFNGIGNPIDGGLQILSANKVNINGRPINPVSRKYPRNFIQTGISAIDALMTLIRGQKLPIFSGNGLNHNQLAAQIVKQAKIKGATRDNFAVVFGAMGVRHDDADYFIKGFERSGVLDHVVMYINKADDPIIERISAPRCALTAAEYLAFKQDMHVLVVLTDMTSYAEALREISSAKEEVPSRKGYPGYLYSDLSTLYERAGMLEGKEGTVTLIPILTMPNDDITHPVPDLTGYITEGQIVLSRDLNQKGLYPPIDILPSLSRLMKDGIGKEYTREDHADLQSQLFSSYAKVQDIRGLAQIIGEDDLSETDKLYLKFGRELENKFINQGENENRSIIETLDLGWNILSILPVTELDRLKSDLIEKYYVYDRER
ncbi:MAG TPA: V-type ATP synthase subunit B [Sedimentibacter sp.]|jgi:V/A-type H+-transporting ATPase subunit B|nr:V-type ATP synthase subunit B [Sedimentibacter sp.]HOK48596.1 V-type ATP synthase subunit B [Sedimentibacter sp.]HOW23032.1 V-type ATP synthase subunit B [Sedimentibacter sp.]HRC80896.1 V-type ATP synthase subunit B [Sedimentibacter sp.]